MADFPLRRFACRGVFSWEDGVHRITPAAGLCYAGDPLCKDGVAFFNICRRDSALRLSALTPPGQAASPNLPNLNGIYRCEGNQTACERLGSGLTIIQSGDELKIHSDKRAETTARLTSSATIRGESVLNLHGIIRSAKNGVILWSNGTTWRNLQTAKKGGTKL